MRVAKIDPIRVTMIEVGRVFAFAERHFLWIRLHILCQALHCQAESKACNAGDKNDLRCLFHKFVIRC